jgi:hypothetical protein
MRAPETSHFTRSSESDSAADPSYRRLPAPASLHSSEALRAHGAGAPFFSLPVLRIDSEGNNGAADEPFPTLVFDSRARRSRRRPRDVSNVPLDEAHRRADRDPRGEADGGVRAGAGRASASARDPGSSGGPPDSASDPDRRPHAGRHDSVSPGRSFARGPLRAAGSDRGRGDADSDRRRGDADSDRRRGDPDPDAPVEAGATTDADSQGWSRPQARHVLRGRGRTAHSDSDAGFVKKTRELPCAPRLGHNRRLFKFKQR